jgi:hypothetical protein
MLSKKEKYKHMKHKVIFIVVFLVYLIVCYYHFRWEKYYDEYYAAAWDPYQYSKIEVSNQVDMAMEYLNLGSESSFEVIDEDSRFITYNNGVVRDKKTGLEWIAGPDRNTTWNEAILWTKSLTIDGGGWRMPTIKELKTLYLEGVGTHNMTPLLKIAGGYIWSSEIKKGSSMRHGFLFDSTDEHWGFPSVFDKRVFAVRSRK